MRVVEGNPADLLNQWPLLLDTDSIESIGVAWLFKEDDRWCFMPRVTGDVSLFYNAVFFVRYATVPAVFFVQVLAVLITGWWWLMLFGVFASVRWSASSTARALLQFGAGWKLNGRIAVLLRIQSDATSAAGSSGPNFGQATGFDFGTH
jgi:hypothetical protein